jgi:hypothetical protein
VHTPDQQEIAMTPTPSPTLTVKRRATRHEAITPASRRRTRKQPQHASRQDQRLLGRYTDRRGNAREVLARPGVGGSVLVLDRDRITLEDLRLVAHLAADEPAENAALVCDFYLRDAATARPRCRLLTDEDLHTAPFANQADTDAQAVARSTGEPVDRLGRRYRLRALQTGMSIPELRWWRETDAVAPPAGGPVSVREVIGATESYEPVRALTKQALSLHDGVEISTSVLRCELARVQQSPIVLNRRLREVVLASVAREELSMSEIALRCGRIKRDRKGNESGETSWLARRLGLLPEGGHHAPTPWIHSDVLALIARSGLGISPHEVEL